MTGHGAIRASDHDREAAVTALREAYAAGRLNLDEFESRVQGAYAAVTWAQLSVLTADLPQQRSYVSEVERPRTVSAASPAPTWLAAALLLSGLAGLWIATTRWPPAVIITALLAALLILTVALRNPHRGPSGKPRR